MTLEFDAIYKDGAFKPTTPVDLPTGTKILITQVVDEGNGKPIRLIGHIERRPNDGVTNEPEAATKEGSARS